MICLALQSAGAGGGGSETVGSNLIHGTKRTSNHDGYSFFMFFLFPPKTKMDRFCFLSSLLNWSFISQWHKIKILHPGEHDTYVARCVFFAVRKTPQSPRAFIPFSFVRFVGSETQAFNALLYAIRSCLGSPMGASLYHWNPGWEELHKNQLGDLDEVFSDFQQNRWEVQA